MELADDRDLALTLEADPGPAREGVNREVTLAKDARVINTFLIVCRWLLFISISTIISSPSSSI
jgi:hypothetical protein